jgi:adenosylcobinamide-GDP ribazoletransferase
MRQGLRVAIRHLTVLPVPWRSGDDDAAHVSLAWFPIVGLVIGALVALILAAPIPAMLRAALALAAWTGMTGALHEDGWMDCADAALAVVPRDRRLEILKDPHVGAHAVTALALVMLVRFSALVPAGWTAPIVAAVCGRWTMVITLARFMPARTSGLGATFARGARALPATVIAAIVIVGLATLGEVRVVAASGAAVAAGVSLAAWLASRFGGLTGDGHGAAGYAAETAALVVMALQLY